MLPDTFSPEVLTQLELLRIRSRRAFLGSRSGGHLSLKRGHGIEFSDYRKYELGDSPRHIDWGVYARTDRLYVKRFQEDQALTVLVMLDTSASMMTPERSGKWEMARDVALSISYIALLAQDSVVLSVPGHFTTSPLYGGRAIHQLGKSLLEFAPHGPKELLPGIQQAAARIRFPGVAVFISDLLMPVEEISRIMNLLMAKNLDIFVVQVLGHDDVSPLEGVSQARAIDSETGEEVELALDDSARSDYEHLLLKHQEEVGKYLANHNISRVTVTSDESLSEFIVRHLPNTGLV